MEKKIKEVFNSQSVKLLVCLCIVSKKATAWMTACGEAEAMQGLINNPQPIYSGSSFDLTWLRMEWEPMDSVLNRRLSSFLKSNQQREMGLTRSQEVLLWGHSGPGHCVTLGEGYDYLWKSRNGLAHVCPPQA